MSDDFRSPSVSQKLVTDAKIGIGPMSLEVVDGIIDFVEETRVPVMLISSRNQVDCAELGGGYAENWTTEAYSKYVASRGVPEVLLCRDHCGPYFRAEESGLNLHDAVESTKQTIKADIDANFDLIHIDSCFCPDQEIEIAQALISYAKEEASRAGREILFEVGTDENTGYPPTSEEFEADLKKILEFVDPLFVVGQTGSLTKEIFQVGYFNYQEVDRLCDIASEYGVRFKEHNCDYVDRMELALRKQAGVGAINVAPEFGVLQTRIVTAMADKFSVKSELSSFRRRVLDSNKWQKWMYSESTHDNIKYLCAGHYCFQTEEYKALAEALNDEFDLGAEIRIQVAALVKHYVRELS